MPKKPIKIRDRKRVRATAPIDPAEGRKLSALNETLGGLIFGGARKPTPTSVVTEPTAEDDVVAEAHRRAVVGKQRLPGKRRRRKSQRDRLLVAIAKREREIATLKRAVALLDATPSKKKTRAARAAVAAKINAPL